MLPFWLFDVFKYTYLIDLSLFTLVYSVIGWNVLEALLDIFNLLDKYKNEDGVI